MKKSNRKRIIYLLAAVTMAHSGAYALSSGETLQQALFAEEIEGNLSSAIADYEKVINDPGASNAHKAQALYRQGMCYLRMEQTERAAAALSQLVQTFPEQSELIAKATPVLEQISDFDPAAFMPPETLAYLEFGDIGGQIETLFEMLKGTPLEDPLGMIAQSDSEVLRENSGLLISRLLNPAMKEDFMKIRGLAVGLVDVNDEQPEIVAVLHLGDSAMLPALLMTGLSMAATPGEKVEGLQTYSIEGQVAIALDNQVLFAATPASRLSQMIRQYKGEPDAASLASANEAFTAVDQVARHQNLATLWVNAGHFIQQYLPAIDPSVPGTFAPDQFVMNSAQSIDDFMLSASLATNQIRLESRLRFKEGVPNMLYDMARTDPLRPEGFKGVPSEAFFLASVALSADNAAQLQPLLTLATEGAIPLGFLENIEQITLFALPGKTESLDMPFCPGIVLKCKHAEVALETIQQLLQQIPDFPPVIAVEVDHQTGLLMLDEAVEKAAFAAIDAKKSALKKGLLHSAIQSQMGRAQKMILLNASGVVQMVRIDEDIFFDLDSSEKCVQELAYAYDQLEKGVEKTTLSVQTSELPNELVLTAQLNDIPQVSTLLPLIVEMNEKWDAVDHERRKAQMEEMLRRRNERLSKLIPADVPHIASVPVLDGELDALWEQAPVYSIEKINASQSDEPSESAKLAANFRMLWDEENLYTFIDVTDSTPVRNPEIGWQFSDNVILYLDATDAKNDTFGKTDYEYAFCWDAEMPELREAKHNQMENVRFRIKTTDKGYTVEAAFPWTTLRTPNPAAGSMIGIDVQLSDNQAGPKRNLQLGWQDDTNGAWLQPSLFGRAKLTGEK